MASPTLSLCIPVYGTEAFLNTCLESLVPLVTKFKDLEILILSDCSHGQDSQGRNCKQIVKDYHKSLKKQKIKIPVEYFENPKNLGTNETRRNLVYAAKGKYIFFIDSDDTINSDGAIKLVEQLKNNTETYDIIDSSFLAPENETEQKLYNHHIFYNYLVNKQIPGFLWTKFISRELLLQAYNQIPPTFCTFAEDFMALFFATWYAKSYYSTKLSIYNYNRTDGITSRTIIDSLDRWEKICSTASAFSVIYLWINEQKQQTGKNPLTTEEQDALGTFATKNIFLNLKQLNQVVAPELKLEARKMLGEYWGENLVLAVEKNISTSS